MAAHLGLKSAQSVSNWERNYGCIIPMYAFKQLLRLYDLPAERAYARFVGQHVERLTTKLAREFYGSTKSRAAKVA